MAYSRMIALAAASARESGVVRRQAVLGGSVACPVVLVPSRMSCPIQRVLRRGPAGASVSLLL
eukprot:4344959-Pyramimonas_sp.AAC.1